MTTVEQDKIIHNAAVALLNGMWDAFWWAMDDCGERDDDWIQTKFQEYLTDKPELASIAKDVSWTPPE